MADETSTQDGTNDVLGSINTTPHLNRKKVKQTALEYATQERQFNGFNRVGKTFLDRIEAQVKAFIRAEVKRHPSKGKTLL